MEKPAGSKDVLECVATLNSVTESDPCYEISELFVHRTLASKRGMESLCTCFLLACLYIFVSFFGFKAGFYFLQSAVMKSFQLLVVLWEKVVFFC